MKTLDLVKLTNAKPYLNLNLTTDMHGIVISVSPTKADVMFFNPSIMDDYIIASINLQDITLENEKLPKEIQKEFTLKMQWLKNNAKKYFTPTKFKNYDYVELINDEKYRDYGLHNGDIGCIVDCTTIKGYVLVDFASAKADEDGFVDCVTVKIDDLQSIKS